MALPPGLGGLLGHRFLRLTHPGRRSGRLYQTGHEVIDYNPQRRESVVLSGRSQRADWYRNVLARPAVAVHTGGARYVPVQRLVDADELYECMHCYVRRNPWAAGLAQRLVGPRFDGSDADRTARTARALVGMAFSPAEGGAPPLTG